jgi:chemotaxis signal transduction protein
MPLSGDEATLALRANRLAQIRKDEQRRKVAHRVAVVQCGGEHFGLPVDGLREIVETPAICTLPGLPVWMPGLSHVRGELLPVMDLRRWLGMEDNKELSCMAVLEGEAGPVGLLVSSVAGFREILADELSDVVSPSDRAIAAMTRDLVAILDIQQLLARAWIAQSPQLGTKTQAT